MLGELGGRSDMGEFCDLKLTERDKLQEKEINFGCDTT